MSDIGQSNYEGLWIKKGIKVRFIGPSNTKPSRFIVTCEKWRIIYSKEFCKDNEQIAAENFIKYLHLDW